ncbi:MAG: wax ester/triacylglycerol synthase family O-acyltransferase, partial [Thermoleophilaceae bacterium]|nr:wax ester/triacylglycerol synthase family O-acyltransferase [Thermoleophilaceae bacterium]
DDVQANIGGVSIMEGPAPAYEELVAQVESKLPLVPRYRQKLQFLPARFGRPIWVDDADFDITNHVLKPNLKAPVSRQQVDELFGEIMGKHLDRALPLWTINVVDGLPKGQWAVLWTVHHAMVDGVAATDLLSLLLDFQRDPAAAEMEEWTPRPAPAQPRAMAQALGAPAGPTKPLRDLRRVLAKPRKAASVGVTALRGLRPLGRSVVKGNNSPLNGPIGPRRRWATAEIDLATIKQVRKATGCTVNDVVLAAVTNGLRELLLSRGESLDAYDTRTMVPVSVRTEDQSGDFANHVSAVFVDLPVAVDDPDERLRLLCEQMTALKENDGATAGEVLAEVADYIQPALFALGERVFWRVAAPERLMNTVTTNVPGPQFPLYCMGREMLSLYPYVMLAKNIRVATAIFSYNDRVFFGVTGDYDTVTDLDVICEGINASVAALLEAA